MINMSSASNRRNAQRFSSHGHVLRRTYSVCHYDQDGSDICTGLKAANVGDDGCKDSSQGSDTLKNDFNSPAVINTEDSSSFEDRSSSHDERSVCHHGQPFGNSLNESPVNKIASSDIGSFEEAQTPTPKTPYSDSRNTGKSSPKPSRRVVLQKHFENTDKYLFEKLSNKLTHTSTKRSPLHRYYSDADYQPRYRPRSYWQSLYLHHRSSKSIVVPNVPKTVRLICPLPVNVKLANDSIEITLDFDESDVSSAVKDHLSSNKSR